LDLSNAGNAEETTGESYWEYLDCRRAYNGNGTGIGKEFKPTSASESAGNDDIARRERLESQAHANGQVATG